LPRAIRAIVERFEGGETALLDELANRRVLAQLTRERVRAGKTQAEVAKAIGRPASDISRFERGDTDPRLSKVVSIADALGGHLAFVPGRRTTVSELADLGEEWDTPDAMRATLEPQKGKALCIVLRGDISEETTRIAEAVSEAIVAASKPLGGSLELHAIFPLEPGETRWEPTAVERAIAEVDSEGGSERVREQLANAEILALGTPTGTVSKDGMTGTESDLLHFTVDEDERAVVLLPVFTRPGFLREPLLRNPDWQRFSVLQINGGSLLGNIDPGVHIVINPWSPLEFQLPSKDEPERQAPFLTIDDAAPDIENSLTVGSSSRRLQPARELVGVS
jgi:transcriptional regulator with XRE-family HTH domain